MPDRGLALFQSVVHALQLAEWQRADADATAKQGNDKRGNRRGGHGEVEVRVAWCRGQGVCRQS